MRLNRKGYHSINVQICDASYMITNVEAKWPGSVHDARMYRDSNLSNINRGIRCVSPIDRGYPCLPTLITPYPNPAPDHRQHLTWHTAEPALRLKIHSGY